MNHIYNGEVNTWDFCSDVFIFYRGEFPGCISCKSLVSPIYSNNCWRTASSIIVSSSYNKRLFGGVNI